MGAQESTKTDDIKHNRTKQNETKCMNAMVSQITGNSTDSTACLG